MVATGPAVHQSGAEPCSFYDYLRFENSDGQEIYQERVMAPAFLDSLIGAGTVATFSIAEVLIPTLFGSKPMHFVYAVESNGKVRKAIEQNERILKSLKADSLKLVWYGFILLMAWGFGLLFWVQAVRFMRISLPLREMHQT